MKFKFDTSSYALFVVAIALGLGSIDGLLAQDVDSDFNFIGFPTYSVRKDADGLRLTVLQLDNTLPRTIDEDDGIYLLNFSAYRAQMEITEDQTDAFRKMFEDLEAQANEFGVFEYSDLDDPNFIVQVDDLYETLHSAYHKEMSKILLPHQLARLKKFARREKADRKTFFEAITTDPIASIIKLGSKQKEQLEVKHEELWPPAEARLRERSMLLRREVLSLLSPEQQAIVRDSLGDEFFEGTSLTEQSISESDQNDFIGLATAELESNSHIRVKIQDAKSEERIDDALRLLSFKVVSEELELSEDQSGEFEEFLKRKRTAAKSIGSEGKEFGFKKFKSDVENQSKAMIANLLLPHQKKLLSQISLQIAADKSPNLSGIFFRLGLNLTRQDKAELQRHESKLLLEHSRLLKPHLVKYRNGLIEGLKGEQVAKLHELFGEDFFE